MDYWSDPTYKGSIFFYMILLPLICFKRGNKIIVVVISSDDCDYTMCIHNSRCPWANKTGKQTASCDLCPNHGLYGMPARLSLLLVWTIR